VTEVDDAEQLVMTLLFCSMSKIVAPDGPTVLPDKLVAAAFKNVTVPKSAIGSRLSPDSECSTIHSASNSQSAGWPENLCVTVTPVLWFTIVAVPPVLEAALTVRVTSSPALMVMPVKSVAELGNHSYQAARSAGECYRRRYKPDRRTPLYKPSPFSMLKSTPVRRIALPQVSPSIPTHADAEAVFSPGGGKSVGTVKVPVTATQVACNSSSFEPRVCLVSAE
jgi:hypothetical protein